MRARAVAAFVAATAGLTLTAAPALPATLTIVNADSPAEGFNDPSPRTPVGGNSATTLGAQRLFVFQRAASIWGALIPSSVEIRVRARFDPMSCTATSAILGSGGPGTVWRDFSNAPVSGHWYHVPLANRLAGTDLHPGGDDLVLTFNSSLGGASCLPAGWYYGVDGNEGSQIELLPVVLHEMGHGLGFSTTTDGQSGSYLSGYPSIYDRYLLDNGSGLHWDQMTASQRAASALSCQNLVWNGANVTREAPGLLVDRPLLRVNTPTAIAGVYSVGVAAFGPTLTATGVTGAVALANDGVGVTSNACEPLINGSSISGRIALVDRGGCPFTTKVRNAQSAGALAVIVADSVPGCPPAAMGGTDPAVTIPSVRVTQDDGILLKSRISSGLNVTLRRDPALSTGADGQNRVMMYAPTSYAGDSSVSHWDTSADPDLLMEPSLTNSVSSNVDLTRWFFADIGWTAGSTDVPPPQPPGPTESPISMATVPNPIQDQAVVQFTLPHGGPVTLELLDLRGRSLDVLIRGEVRAAGPHTLPLDTTALGNGIYFLRLTLDGETTSRKVAIAH